MLDIKGAIWGMFKARYMVPVQAAAARLMPMTLWFL